MHIKERIQTRLRDPIWQFVGVVITVVSILLPLILITRDDMKYPNRIMISSQTSKVLTDFPYPINKRFQFVVDGNEVYDLHLHVYLVEYKGKAPIRAVDYETPITANIPSDRKLISVRQATNIEGPVKFDKEKNRLARSEQPAIDFDAQIVDDTTFHIKPVLMNPGDWYGIEIYTSRSNINVQSNQLDKSKSIYSEISWKCHVAGVQCPGIIDLDIDFDHYRDSVPDFMDVSIYHNGWAVYFILVFSVVSIISYVIFTNHERFDKFSNFTRYSLFSVAIVFSIASAEVAADWFFEDPIFKHDQPLFAYIIFWLNIVIIIVLALIKALNKKHRNGLEQNIEMRAKVNNSAKKRRTISR